ncbi:MULTISPECIES: RPA family protein [unclassified Halorubrum]|uniref:RPA family protein n=1 Tax=unclassified Halorubrum TaxID=2642239 RepID=UPI000B987885|nr:MULTISPECIES: DNA-binding protein [unclassified Halorubrum]OYR39854.1 DNA-binding protein [Halorubrum sp. Eb13]OYR43414.1 DNA-binding protein [Halorubrum sp. Hd13]OYR46808.1 DNA-binding protein [Halorubrum sp. Ea8]OYR54692.1 DNA-binding protein [Halorubrum sp. Ea1]
MSQSAPTREVARRVFASEFNDAGYTFTESDDERAPVYALLPTGESSNRVFFVGTLTEKEDVGEDSEYWRGRIVDPTGTFFVYAGQYQPEAASKLRDLEPPAYVAVVGKPRTYETDDGTVRVSVRPESITEVDAATRDRWVAETATRTIERVAAFDDDGNEYARMAREEYDLDPQTYKAAALSALEDLDEGDELAGDAADEDRADGDTAGDATDPAGTPEP